LSIDTIFLLSFLFTIRLTWYYN